MLSIIKISVLLNQGIPFIHADQEFFRTKGGIENSYNANDSVNKIDWKRKSKNEDINVEVEKANPWSVLENKYNSGTEVIDVIDKNIIKVSAISTFVAIR